MELDMGIIIVICGCAMIGGVLVFSIGATHYNPQCFKMVAQNACGNLTLITNFGDETSFIYLGGSPDFSCCDYSNVDAYSREVEKNSPTCKSYTFLQSDVEMCKVS